MLDLKHHKLAFDCDATKFDRLFAIHESVEAATVAL
jgi:hypothetical protein